MNAITNESAMNGYVPTAATEADRLAAGIKTLIQPTPVFERVDYTDPEAIARFYDMHKTGMRNDLNQVHEIIGESPVCQKFGYLELDASSRNRGLTVVLREFSGTKNEPVLRNAAQYDFTESLEASYRRLVINSAIPQDGSGHNSTLQPQIFARVLRLTRKVLEFSF